MFNGSFGDVRQCKLGVSFGERSDGGKRLRSKVEQENLRLLSFTSLLSS